VAKCKARLIIETENAGLMEKAVTADNPPYIISFVEGNKMMICIESGSAGSMLATLDDLLVNLKVADELLEGHGTVEGQED